MRKNYKLRIIKDCRYCGKKFLSFYKKAHFCSRKCYFEGRKDKKFYREINKKISQALKGRKFSKVHRRNISKATRRRWKDPRQREKLFRTCFKKGRIPWNKGKIMPHGEKSPVWKGGSIHYWTPYYLKERNYRCEYPKCKWVVTLEVHHIDGDRNNWRPENIKVLCPNHHSITPNWHNKKRKEILSKKFLEIENSR